MAQLNSKTIKLGLTAIAVSIALAGCSSSKKQEEVVVDMGIDPRYLWIDAPRQVSDVPLVATECVKATSHRNIDSSRADMMARNSLAQQIKVTAQGLQRGYNRALFDQGGELNTATFDEQGVRNLVNQSLVGSYRKRGSYVEREGEGRAFCSMMEVSQDGIDEMLKTIAKMNSMKDGSDLFTKDQLREQLMSKRMMESLDDKIEQAF